MKRHVAGVESFAIDPDELGGVLQRKFYTNSSVQRLPGKTETSKEIALQGDILHEVGQFLMTTFGIEQQFIELKSKSKGG